MVLCRYGGGTWNGSNAWTTNGDRWGGEECVWSVWFAGANTLSHRCDAVLSLCAFHAFLRWPRHHWETATCTWWNLSPLPTGRQQLRLESTACRCPVQQVRRSHCARYAHRRIVVVGFAFAPPLIWGTIIFTSCIIDFLLRLQFVDWLF